jgi:hypothetical protein
MADIAQVLATGGTTIVAVAVGAGLTYWLGALNRRHQEGREDRTRFMQERFQAYSEFTRTAYLLARSGKRTFENLDALTSAVASVNLVASSEVLHASIEVSEVVNEELHNRERLDVPVRADSPRLENALARFTNAARRDLGHPPVP